MTAPPNESRPPRPTLVLETPAGLRRVPLDREVSIGRDRRCDVVLDHPTVSRQHARLVQDADAPAGWRYEEIATEVRVNQRGERRPRGGRHLHRPIPLADGTTLKIGRVRAWFFERGPADDWRPGSDVVESPADHGRLVRCPTCQHVGWAPDYTSGMAVRCRSCRAEIEVVSEPRATVSVPAPLNSAGLTCPACRGVIRPPDETHTCPGCGARMHVDCYRELGGCATYGCTHVDELNNASALDDSAALPAATETIAPRREWPAAIGWSVVGLASFGLPAFAWAGHGWFARRDRSLPRVAAFGGGLIGLAASAIGWATAFDVRDRLPW